MPIYQWKCTKCHAERETLQAHTAPPPECLQCAEAPPMSKRISRSSFILKGPGWAKDGYQG